MAGVGGCVVEVNGLKWQWVGGMNRREGRRPFETAYRMTSAPSIYGLE